MTAISPEPRKTPVSAIPIVFSEPIINFGLDDLVLSRNGDGIVANLQEVEPNNNIASGQNVDAGAWTLAPNSSVLDSTIIPHLSIFGTGDNSFDFYKFTATAGSS